MCCLVLIHGPQLPGPLGELAPWLDQTVDSLDDVRSGLDAQDHRRVIKTHTPLDGLPGQAEVTYVAVGRDPRDVVLSAGDHSADMRIESIVAARSGQGACRAAEPPAEAGGSVRSDPGEARGGQLARRADLEGEIARLTVD